MAKYCGKCGAKINKKGECSKCNQKKKKKIPAVGILIVILIMVIAFTGVVGTLVYYDVVEVPILSKFFDTLGVSRSEVEKDSNEAIKKLISGDVEEVNEIIFKEYNAIENSRYAELFEEEEEDSVDLKGTMAGLFTMVRIKMVRYSDTTISYQIYAPDMSNFFVDCMENMENIKDVEMLSEYLLSYAANAQEKETEVSISYTYIENEFYADYQSYEFIDAMSGGLVGAYVDLYSEMLEEYRNEVK